MKFINRYRRIIIPVTSLALALLIYIVYPKDQAVETGDLQISGTDTVLSETKKPSDVRLAYDFIIDIEKPDIRGDKDDSSVIVTDTDAVSTDDDNDSSTVDSVSTVPEKVSETDETSVDSISSDSSGIDEDPVDSDTGSNDSSDDVKLYDVPLTAEKQLYAVQIAEEFDIPVELIFGVMYVESRYHETSVSRNGKCIGIMQIASGHLTKLNSMFGITDLLDYYQNVKAGAYYLSYYYSMYGGDVNKTLMCYHYGGGGAKRQWEKGNTEDDYCRKVAGEINRITATGTV